MYVEPFHIVLYIPLSSPIDAACRNIGSAICLLNQSRSAPTDATPAANPAYCTLELGVEMAFSAGSATLVDIGQGRMGFLFFGVTVSRGANRRIQPSSTEGFSVHLNFCGDRSLAR